MRSPANPLQLAHWRRSVSEIYAQIRRDAHTDPVTAWRAFRVERDKLFKKHPQSPLDDRQQDLFTGLSYFDYDPAWRVKGEVDFNVAAETYHVNLGDDGDFRYTRVAYFHFALLEEAASLALYWVEGYGGGLFLPFADVTNGHETFGGGRYLIDTIKGADPGISQGEMVLDFNFAYNPSCAYNSRWVCPLSPLENRLPFPVMAGERNFN